MRHASKGDAGCCGVVTTRPLQEGSHRARKLSEREQLSRAEILANAGMKLSEHHAPPGFRTFYDNFYWRGIFCSCGNIGSFFCTSRTCRNIGVGQWDGPFDFASFRHGPARSSRAICAPCFGKLSTTYKGIALKDPDASGEVFYNIEEVPDYFVNRQRVPYSDVVPWDQRTAHCNDCLKMEKRKPNTLAVKRGYPLFRETGNIGGAPSTSQIVASCNATSKDFILRSFENGQSFYREIFSPRNVQLLLSGLQGNISCLEDLDGVAYHDVEGLRRHISTILYCILVFQGSHLMPKPLHDAAVSALHLPKSWKMGEDMGEDMGFWERVQTFVVPDTHVVVGASRREDIYANTRAGRREALKGTAEGAKMEKDLELGIERVTLQAFSMPPAQKGRRNGGKASSCRC